MAVHILILIVLNAESSVGFSTCSSRVNLNLPNNPRRVASNHMELRHIFCHYTTRPNGDSSTKSNTRTNGNIAPQPAIFSNGDWLAELRPLSAIAEKGIQRMRGTIKGAVWTDQSAGSD
jgi:hypothetical protein